MIREENLQAKLIFKGIKDFLFIIYMILVLSLIFLMLLSKFSGTEPRLLSHRIYIVDSGSMSPSLKVDSLIIVKETPASEIRTGDIVTYYGQDRSVRVTHRVTEVLDQGRAFVTKGDANNTTDASLLKEERLIGKVVYTLPHVGKVFRFVKTKQGLALLLAIVGTWMIITLVPLGGKKK